MPVTRKSLEFLGFLDYQVDIQGVVWSRRLKGNNRYADWHPLTTYPNGEPDINGRCYRKVQLYHEGRRKFFAVHHLVLLAFVGPRPFPKAQARHLNDNPEDNRVSNLAWGTQAQNMADLRRNGRSPDRAGERNSQSKLTEEQVRFIRRNYVPRAKRRKDKPRTHKGRHNPDYKKWTRRRLADHLGVSVSAVDFVIDRPNGRWKGIV